jgi:hypothetical protein
VAAPLYPVMLKEKNIQELSGLAEEIDTMVTEKRFVNYLDFSQHPCQPDLKMVR